MHHHTDRIAHTTAFVFYTSRGGEQSGCDNSSNLQSLKAAFVTTVCEHVHCRESTRVWLKYITNTANHKKQETYNLQVFMHLNYTLKHIKRKV